VGKKQDAERADRPLTRAPQKAADGSV